MTRHQRTRSGCLTCRSRRKKCDEVKPRCAGCRRNQLPCNWPSTVAVTATSGSNGRETSAGGVHNQHQQQHHHRASHALLGHPSQSSPLATIHQGVESQAPQRACMLTPQSVNLFSHFIVHTATAFAMGPAPQNPFISVLVPLASTDDLLMHALLAVSGAHMLCNDPFLPIGEEVTRAAGMHYSRLITGLRTEFISLTEDDLQKKERLLRLLLVACHYEAVSGNAYGALFGHLNASRYLIKSLVANKDKSNQIGYANLSLGTLGFSIELYTYMMLCNTLTMPPAYQDTIADTFVMSFEEMAHYPTFGSFFAGAHDLYQLIPDIAQLGARRFAEEASGLNEPSTSAQETFDALSRRIHDWTMPTSSQFSGRGWEWQNCAAEVWRHALHIYLITSLAGSVVPDQVKSSSVAFHTVEAFTLVGKLVSSQHSYFATMLWPVLVSGSCLREQEGQQQLSHIFRTTYSGMRHMSLWADVLQLMWDDADARAYGPHGLVFTMQKHDKIIPIL